MLKYTLSFDRPWAFALLALLAFLIFFPYFRTPANKRRRIGRLVSLVARTLACVITVFLLAGTTFTEVSAVPESTSMVIVVDYSESTEELHERMETYVEQMLQQADENTSVALVKFAGNAVQASDFSNRDDVVLGEFLTSPRAQTKPYDATNIADALRLAGQLFPEETRDNKRIVLLSDGRETFGNAWEAAGELVSRNIRLDTVSFNVTADEYAEVSLLSFDVLPSQIIDHGKSVRLQVKAHSSVDTEGTLSFYDGDKIIIGYKVSLNRGDNLFTQTYVLDGANDVGMHELRAVLTPESDSVSQNNSLGTWVKVNGKAKVLIVDGTGRQAAKLEEQISNLYDTETVSPANFPTSMEKLLEYDEIILMEVDAGDLPVGSDVLINRYVANVGRGLLTTTGTSDNNYRTYEGTLLSDMLPVTMTLDETVNNVAIVLVIDDSSSMIPGAYGTVEKFQPALDGAQKVIEALGENDYIGIVTFHGEMEIRQQLVKAEDKTSLIELVQGLDAKNHFGTSYSAGLNAAYDMLRDFKGARSKHVVFLSDGAPTDTHYENIPKNMKNSGITLSTISLLADGGAKDLMAKMADNGGGKHYSIDSEEDLSMLADIMEDLTLKAKEPQFVNEEPFTPSVGTDETGVLNGVKATELIMGGYIGSTLKNDATMSLYADDFRPIIAEWQWGKGYVCTFMTDLSGEWCAEVFGSDIGLRLIRNLAGQSLNEEIQSTGLDVRITQSDRTANISVSTTTDRFGQVMVARIIGEETVEVVLTKVSSSVYRGSFPTPDPNRVYRVEVALYTDEERTDVLDRTILAYSGGILAEYDLFGIDGDALLTSIASMAGGERMQEVASLFSVIPAGEVEYKTRALLPCSVALALLLFLDIIARNINITPKTKKK